MSENNPFPAAAVALISALGGYNAPEKPVVALVAPRQREHDDKEDLQPEEQIQEPQMSEISVGAMDTARLQAYEEAWVKRIPNLTDVLRELYESEINCSVSSFWDGGWDVKLGDTSNGFLAETNVTTLDEAARWLHEQAHVHFPLSDYAAKFPR